MLKYSIDIYAVMRESVRTALMASVRIIDEEACSRLEDGIFIYVATELMPALDDYLTDDFQHLPSQAQIIRDKYKRSVKTCTAYFVMTYCDKMSPQLPLDQDKFPCDDNLYSPDTLKAAHEVAYLHYYGPDNYKRRPGGGLNKKRSIPFPLMPLTKAS